MSAIKPSFEGLEVLRPYSGHWCVWRLMPPSEPNTKPKKVPFKGRGKGMTLSAKTTDGWLPFDEAKGLYNRGCFDGGGLLMLNSEMLCVVDIDGCLDDNGIVVPTAAAVVDEVASWGSYIELSQSGRGLHCFVRSVRLDGAGEKVMTPGGHSLEVYDSDSERYICATGVEWPEVEPGRKVEMRQAEIEAFMLRWGFVKESAGGCVGAVGGVAPACKKRSDEEILTLLRERNKRGKVTRLLSGDTVDYGGDHSAADMGLLCEITYYTRDAGQIDGIFRQSGLMREKWEREDYRQRSIRKALGTVQSSFDEDQKAKIEAKAVSKARVEGLKAKGSTMLAGGIEDLLDAKGRLPASIYTVSELLVRDKALVGAVFFDEFIQRPQKSRGLGGVLGKSAPNTVGDITDDDLRALAAYLGRQWGLDVRMDTIAHGVALWARTLSRNPVMERLDELAEAWDGRERLATWLMDYCAADTKGASGKDISAYVGEAGRRWLIQVTARAYQPGVKADSMLVLEGRQGARKSTLARVICEAITPNAFLEGFSISGQSDQDRSLMLEGKLVVEWGELAGLSRHETDEIKRFISQQEDTYRRPYDRTSLKFARTATFIATTNEGQYLRDLSGNRRWWPIKVGTIDIERLKADAGQIIGEAVHQYRAGARWWFDEHGGDDVALVMMAVGEQMARLIEDVWDDIAMDLSEAVASGGLEIIDARSSDKWKVHPDTGCRLSELMAAAGIEDSGDTGGKALKFGRSLRKAGWVSYKSSGRMKWKLPKKEAMEVKARM